MSRARPSVRVVAVAVALLAVAGCKRTGKTPAPPAAKVDHVLRIDGPADDHPYYPKLYVRTRPSEDAPWEEWTAHPFGPDGSFDLRAEPGASYQACSELEPSPAMQGVFWMIRADGVLGDGSGEVAIPQPPRARVRLLVGASPNGTDVLTVYDEGTDTAGWALNVPAKNLYEGFRRGGDTNCYLRRALQRPCLVDTFRPGRYVVAARVNGRQWIARRMELEPDSLVDLDAGAQPAGGGRVVCENGDALLLLRGDLPIPMAYEDPGFRYRAVWEGVPPGDHAVRYPDGTRVPATVVDGADTLLPRTPAPR